MNRFFPTEETYTTAFQNMWKYINTWLWDAEFGGFYNNGLDESPNDKNKRKAHNWKGPYHDGRALMNILEYSKK